MAEDFEPLILQVIELSGAAISVVAVKHKPKLVELRAAAENIVPLVGKLKVATYGSLRRDLVAHLKPTVSQLGQVQVGTTDFEQFDNLLDRTTRFLAALPGKPGLGPG